MSSDMPSNGAWSTPRNMGSHNGGSACSSSPIRMRPLVTPACPPMEWIESGGVPRPRFPYDRSGDWTFPPSTFDVRAPMTLQMSPSVSMQVPARTRSRHSIRWMHAGRVWTVRTLAQEPDSTLGEVLVTPSKVPDEFILSPESLIRPGGWIYLKGSKREERKGTDGFTYRYRRGPCDLPRCTRPTFEDHRHGRRRTRASRFKHVVTYKPTRSQKERLDADERGCDAGERGDGLAGIGMGSSVDPGNWSVSTASLMTTPQGHPMADGRSSWAMLWCAALWSASVRRSCNSKPDLRRN